MFAAQAMYNTAQALSVLQAHARRLHVQATVARTARAPAVYRRASIQSTIVAVAAMSVVQATSPMARVSSAHRVHVEPQPVIPAIARRMAHVHPETSIPTPITAEAAVMFVVRAMIPMPQHFSVFPVSVKPPHVMVTIAQSMEAVSPPV